MAGQDDAAEYVTTQYTAAVWDKDIDGLLALYATEVRVFDLFDQWSHDGSGAWRAALEAWFTFMGDTRVRVTFDDVRSIGAGDLRTVTALIGYVEVSAEGAAPGTGPMNAMSNRLSWTLQRRDAAWVILHEHTSVPIDGESFTGLFER